MDPIRQKGLEFINKTCAETNQSGKGLPAPQSSEQRYLLEEKVLDWAKKVGDTALDERTIKEAPDLKLCMLRPLSDKDKEWLNENTISVLYLKPDGAAICRNMNIPEEKIEGLITTKIYNKGCLDMPKTFDVWLEQNHASFAGLIGAIATTRKEANPEFGVADFSMNICLKKIFSISFQQHIDNCLELPDVADTSQIDQSIPPDYSAMDSSHSEKKETPHIAPPLPDILTPVNGQLPDWDQPLALTDKPCFQKLFQELGGKWFPLAVMLVGYNQAMTIKTNYQLLPNQLFEKVFGQWVQQKNQNHTVKDLAHNLALLQQIYLKDQLCKHYNRESDNFPPLQPPLLDIPLRKSHLPALLQADNLIVRGASGWDDIGTMLGLSTDVKNIKEQSLSCKDAFLVLLATAIERNPEFTLSDILRAVETCGYVNLAQDMRKLLTPK